MRISVVVPAYNEERLLGESLKQIQAAAGAFTALGWESEIIVCDNNSNDRTAEIARAAGARVVFEPINQIARARNTGASHATGRWLVFVDADSHPTSGLFAAVANRITSGRVLAGGSTVKLASDQALARRATRVWNFISRTLTMLAGSFIFCEAAAFKKVGGFSHELFAGEEIELTARLKQEARRQHKKLVVLKDHPLLTSDRKIHLYKTSDHVWFFIKAVLRTDKTLKSREQCYAWYDGRR